MTGCSNYFVEEIRATGCQISQENLFKILMLDISLIIQGLRVWVEKNTSK
jgi:hypothetical protein